LSKKIQNISGKAIEKKIFKPEPEHNAHFDASYKHLGFDAGLEQKQYPG